MSADDILDVLNIQRADEAKQPSKKKQKVEAPRQTGMARELYSLLGPNTPPVALSSSGYTSTKDRFKAKPSPWTRMPFSVNGNTFSHWVKGSRELLEQGDKKEYFFDKFNVKIDVPELVPKEKFDEFMAEIKEREAELKQEREKREQERKEREKERQRERQERQKEKEKEKEAEKEKEEEKEGEKKKEKDDSSKKNGDDKEKAKEESTDNTEQGETDEIKEEVEDWTYEETKYLFELCLAFELKWQVIYDRFNYGTKRTMEDLEEQFYRISLKTLQSQGNANPALIDSLKAYSKHRELERKEYLENLLKRTPAEIAEEESLVIEARRFELAAKKMLMERSNLLTLLDSPQTTQSILNYQSSQGLTNLYNNLMIIDKNQKKLQVHLNSKSSANQEPVPPTIPIAAASSFKKDRSFQTHLQQYLSGLVKQSQNANPQVKQEANAIQQLLAKRLTQKEEEAYGLHFHGTERLTPGVVLRSSQRLPGLQQKQSVLRSVNSVLQELDIPTAGGTSWKPTMPTRKTMAKYDELIRSVVALLDVKRGKDKLESEIRLIKSQRGLQ